MPDLAIANYIGSNVSVLLGVGDGTFATRNYPAGNNPQLVAIGDLNGDQVNDLAVANVASDNVSVLLGVGEPRSLVAAQRSARVARHQITIWRNRT